MTDAAAWCRALVARLAGTPLLVLPRRVPIEAAYQPLLVDWTDEDAAARGLRKAPTERAAPVHHTALERAAAEPILLLTGEAGSGRTTFCRHLALHLAGEILRDPGHPLRPRPVPRGEGAPVRAERWDGPVPVPLLVEARGPGTPDTLLRGHAAILAGTASERPVLLIVDDADRLSGDWAASLLALASPALRLLMTAAPGSAPGLPGLRRHALLPLMPAQRAAFRAACGVPGAPDAAWLGRPGLLSLSVAASGDAPDALVESWLAAALAAAGLPLGVAGDLRRAALGAPLPPATEAALRAAGLLNAVSADFIRPFLAARALDDVPPAKAVTAPPAAVRLLAVRCPETAPALAAALLDAGADPLLAAELGADDPALRPRLTDALLTAIAAGTLTPARRASAGRRLSRLDDPRDLEALVAIPAGPFTMGSAAHPNSAPLHQVTLGAYRIGRYPVTNRLYRRLVEAAGRRWLSPHATDPAFANAPAADLTWRDALAFCAWIAPLWRAEGRIAATETVRLPTEPEWERAARGPDPTTFDPPFPYPGPWQPGRANDEAAGLNDVTAVGLFPQGRSAEGCEDLCGGVWEWCSTLWGTDMAEPSFRYPYAEDGREDPDAGPAVRRVLRGGCFSSAPWKASATYRGSLEPDGFWRGNGFRVVVAKDR